MMLSLSITNDFKKIMEDVDVMTEEKETIELQHQNKGTELSDAEECSKNTGVGEKKTMKKPNQTSRGVSVSLKIGFKPQKEYRLVPKKSTASSSGNKKKGVEPTIEVSNSNPFVVLNSVNNNGEFRTNSRNTPIGEKFDKIERQICEGKLSVRIKRLHNDIRVTTTQVIANDDLVSSVTSASAEGPIPPKTAEQKLARKNELKAKSTLMLAIPDEHLLKFHACKDANQLEIHGKVISQKDPNLKLLRSLPSAWNNIALIMRNKSDVDTLSMDDLYNNLKVYESEIKSQSSSSLNSHNVAFVSSNNTSSTNETVNTTHSVFTASSKDQASTTSYVDDVMFSFFFNQSNALQLENEDLEQIDTDDLKEIDLKWQVAMLTIRVKRFIKKTSRKLDLNGKDAVGFDRTKVKCNNCHRRGHFARECRAPRNWGNRNRDAPTRNAPVDTSTTNTLVIQDGIGGYDWSFRAKEELINFALMAYTSQDKTGLGYDGQMNESDLNDIHVNESEVPNNLFYSRESNRDDNQVNDRFKKATVLTKSGQVPVNAAKQSSHRAAATVSAARRVNIGNPQYALQDQEIFNSGCSRHMTGNKSYLTDYQEIDTQYCCVNSVVILNTAKVQQSSMVGFGETIQ
nr:hypothetical protein [Tanacetum cinerariifolium]